MSVTTIRAKLQEWAERETGLTFIYGRQAKPRPNIPYGEITFVGAGARVGGIDEYRLNGIEQSIQGQREALVSLNIYGSNANEIMTDLIRTLDTPAVVEEFIIAGFSHFGENGPNDLTQLEDTRYLERSQATLQIRYAFENDVTGDTIYQVELTSTYESPEETFGPTTEIIGEAFED
jgi:hypothetical protein